MRILLVTFETSSNHAAMLAAIKLSGDWARLTNGTYLVKTYETTEQLRDRLMAHRGAAGLLWVGTAPAPSAWVGLPQDVSAWIQKNQS